MASKESATCQAERNIPHRRKLTDSCPKTKGSMRIYILTNSMSGIATDCEHVNNYSTWYMTYIITYVMLLHCIYFWNRL